MSPTLPTLLLFALAGGGCGLLEHDPEPPPPPPAAREPEPVEPLPPPETDQTAVRVQAEDGGEVAFAVGDRVRVTSRIGMISKRFNGLADVVVEPPHEGRVVAVRTDAGLLDVEWAPGAWRVHAVDPAAAETVQLGAFVSPVHAVYLERLAP